MYQPDYTHLVGFADTDTLGKVDSLAAIRARRQQRPVTPPQWRYSMVAPIPGTHPLQMTPDPAAAADRLTEPQAPVPPLPPNVLPPRPVYAMDPATSEQFLKDLRFIRNLLIWCVLGLVIFACVSVAIGTAIAGDIQNFQNLTGTLPGQ